jgi:hypothetical protein
MRFYISMAVFLLVSSFGIAQEIVDPNKLWSCMEEHCQPWGSTYSTDFLRFEEDTIIDGFTYKKVWISEDENYQIWDFYGAFIREENKRVYYRQMFGLEGLIYDFNISLGDSVTVNNPRAAGEITLFLEEIDSVLTDFGYLERWILKSESYPNSEYWIRGIGSQTGVINSSSGIFGGLCGLYTLLCQKENDELVYINTDYESCYLYVTVQEDIEEDQSKVIVSFDNSTREVHINLIDELDRSVYISDIRGNIIATFETHNKIIRHNMTGYTNGVYIVVIVSNEKYSARKFLAY